MSKYVELLKRVVLVHAAIHEQNPPSKKIDLHAELIEFNKGCVAGYADNLTDEENEKLNDLLNECLETYAVQGINVDFIQNSIDAITQGGAGK